MFTRSFVMPRFGMALVLGVLFFSGSLTAQEVVWRAAKPAAGDPSVSAVRLLPPSSDLVVRAQGADIPPPPPPPPGAVSPFPGGPPPGEEDYNCGVANTKQGYAGGFFTRAWEGTKSTIGGVFETDPGRTLFQSDDDFNVFISPVTNPFYFEDPRALTEFRPTFMWQRTREGTPIFAGGDNFFLNLRGSVAFTDRISLVVHRLGLVWTEVQQPQLDFANHFGISEIHVGPKFTFIRNCTSNTLAAAGLVFELPVGSSDVQQDTGSLSLRPYVSFAQNFLRSEYGSFNFMNTTGYAYSTDDQRSDFLFSSFHLDYEIAKKVYPFIEANFIRYTSNGNARNINFEGGDLFNFGAMGIAGQNQLNLALGFRYKFSECVQFGIAGETGVVGGDRNMDRYRVTFDMIFRY